MADLVAGFLVAVGVWLIAFFLMTAASESLLVKIAGLGLLCLGLYLVFGGPFAPPLVLLPGVGTVWPAILPVGANSSHNQFLVAHPAVWWEGFAIGLIGVGVLAGVGYVIWRIWHQA